MMKRTYTTKSETVFEWEETKEVSEAVKKLTEFAGNYEGPLYTPNPNLKKER